MCVFVRRVMSVSVIACALVYVIRLYVYAQKCVYMCWSVYALCVCVCDFVCVYAHVCRGVYVWLCAVVCGRVVVYLCGRLSVCVCARARGFVYALAIV